MLVYSMLANEHAIFSHSTLYFHDSVSHFKCSSILQFKVQDTQDGEHMRPVHLSSQSNPLASNLDNNTIKVLSIGKKNIKPDQ